MMISMNKLFYNGPTFAALHNNYAKQHKIDEQAQIVTESSITINAPVETVWNIIADIKNYPSFAPDFTDIQVSEVAVDQPLQFKVKGFPIRATFSSVEPNHFLIWTGKSLWTKAIDYHELRDLGDGTCFLIVKESLAGAFLPWFYKVETLQQQHKQWLAGVKQTAERSRA